MSYNSPDYFVSVVFDIYSTLSFKPPATKYTILASVLLSRLGLSRETPEIKVLSLASGSKCLPSGRLPPQGDALHDSHAEVLARRGAIRWLLEEAGRCTESLPSGQAFESDWIDKGASGKYCLKDGVQMHLYVSTAPCGDASMRLLASVQDQEMAALKDSVVRPTTSENAASRGRDNYSLYGVLRTKPGRADSPPTLSMSCSDKIAVWNVLGIQGALGSRIFAPIYISTVIIGDVDQNMRATVTEDCERAFWKRLGVVGGLPQGFEVHRPSIQFTSLPFIHSRSSLGLSATTSSSCNESLCWFADSSQPHEVLINGIRRGTAPKHQHTAKFRPSLSKISLFKLYNQSLKHLGLPPESDSTTYFEAKHSVKEYQMAKRCLMQEGGCFSAWIKSGAQWESFNSEGNFLARNPLY